MRNSFLYRRAAPSNICKELINNTVHRKIEWVSYKNFSDYLELEGINFDYIGWFRSYISHTQEVEHYVRSMDVYFTYYRDRVFAVSQNKYNGQIRNEFTSCFDKRCMWYMVVDNQYSLKELYHCIQIMNSEDTSEECRNLLMATGSIHV